jgi:hypothetical protein
VRALQRGTSGLLSMAIDVPTMRSPLLRPLLLRAAQKRTLSDSDRSACPTRCCRRAAYAVRHHDPITPLRNAVPVCGRAKGTTDGGALGPGSARVGGDAVWLPHWRTAAQLRSARGAGVLPSLGIARFESIGACCVEFESEGMAGDVGMPGFAAAGLGLFVCAPGVTWVAAGSVDGVAGVVGVCVGVVLCVAGEVGVWVFCASAYPAPASSVASAAAPATVFVDLRIMNSCGEKGIKGPRRHTCASAMHRRPVLVHQEWARGVPAPCRRDPC